MKTIKDIPKPRVCMYYIFIVSMGMYVYTHALHINDSVRK